MVSLGMLIGFAEGASVNVTFLPSAMVIEQKGKIPEVHLINMTGSGIFQS